MTKQNIAITKHEDKTSQNGRDYTVFDTNLGKMSCFESDVIASCKENEGKIISVEVAESEKDGRTWRNIRGFNEVVVESQNSQNVPVIKIPPAPVETAEKHDKMVNDVVHGKNTTMYTSYAKDILIAMINSGVDGKHDNLMSKAIELVEQARDSFS